jgi:hypothetical protein
MTVACASCQRYLGTRPPFRDLGVTHGTCTACAVRQRRELSTLVVSRERADAAVAPDSRPRVRVGVSDPLQGFQAPRATAGTKRSRSAGLQARTRSSSALM